MFKTILAIAVLVGVAVVWAALVTRKPRSWSRQRVIAALANALDLDDTGYHDEFDMFLAGPLSDPSLEALRLEILSIVQNEERMPGCDFGPNAEGWLRRTYESLTQGSD
jgi:hypothetical protein